MAEIIKDHDGTCARCGSRLIYLEWDERFDPHQVQQLWKCLECRNEFVTFRSSEGRSPTGAEIIEPFFTNLVVE